MKLFLDQHSFGYEMENILRLFLPPGAAVEKIQGPETGEAPAVMTQLRREDAGIRIAAAVRLGGGRRAAEDVLPPDAEKPEQERAMAILLYQLLSQETGTRPPWGILTGIRPVKLARSMMEGGLSAEETKSVLEEKYLVSPEKICLALDTAGREASALEKSRPDGFSLYVAIPFCPSRCSYCSFVSHSIEKTFRLVPDYLKLLEREIRLIGEIAARRGLVLQTVYIGGGTPTVLEAEQLDSLLGRIRQSFDFASLLEYTVEAGRPDTISLEKLEILRKWGTTRISINPQTFQDGVLREIGRTHTAGQAVAAYELARGAGFDCVNMDLIAGLPGDSLEGFSSTLERAVALNPENITVHTLTVKRSAHLREAGFYSGKTPVEEMASYSQERLRKAGYAPYYMYRQKGAMGNLENVGFCKPGMEGYYNVYIMDETHTILAAGAGAVTKLCAPGRVERVYNHKFPYEYIGRFSELAARKERIVTFYETNNTE